MKKEHAVSLRPHLVLKYIYILYCSYVTYLHLNISYTFDIHVVIHVSFVSFEFRDFPFG